MNRDFVLHSPPSTAVLTMNCLRCVFTHDSTVTARRMFASTPVNAVLRCQQTYDMPKPEIDRSGRPRRHETTYDASEGDIRGSHPRGRSGERNGSFDYPRRGSQYHKTSDFERSERSRPIGKKGGFGLKTAMKQSGDEVMRSSGSRSEGNERQEGQERRPLGYRQDSDRGRSTVATGFGSPKYRRDDPERRDHDSRNVYPSINREYKGSKHHERRVVDGGESWKRDEGPRRFDRSSGGRDSFARSRTGGRDEDLGRPGDMTRHARNDARDNLPQSETDQPWAPTKKLTFQAMAGLRALHANDPATFDKDALSQRYGISYDAVSRILRSNYQDRKGQETGERIQGTKWDMNPATSRLSPVPAINRAFGRTKSGNGSG